MGETTSRERLGTYATAAAVLCACLPTLVFAYLPMTDLPQHLAIASVLRNHGDPTFSFDTYYVVDWWRTPYVLPYAIAVALSHVMPLAIAMRIVVFLSVVAYPFGVMALLRAARKPVWFALLTIPLIYDRAFFWGFINFKLGVGLAFAAFACVLSQTQNWRRDVLQAFLTLAATFTHVYGLALLFALVGLFGLTGGYRSLRGRPWTLVPLLVGSVLWFWKSAGARGFGDLLDPPLLDRLVSLPREILGGYQDKSESVVLLLAVAAWAALARTTIPFSAARVRALTIEQRVAYVVFLGNFALYLYLPQATWTAKFIHFRHAFLACSLLPLVCSPTALGQRGLLTRALPAIAAAAATFNAWTHLALFDREARSFDRVIDALPDAPRVASFVFDRNGLWMQSDPYLHFAAYAQAVKGGVVSMTFPEVFWNLPVEIRPDSPKPEAPIGIEWNPRGFDQRSFGYFFDYAVVRVPGNRIPATSTAFPYAPVMQSGSWYLYKRLETGTRPP